MTVSRDKLIESAKKLDRQLGNESTFLTKVNEIIVDHSDANKVADLYKSIYLFQKENKKSKISQTLKELSDNLACYLGYSYLFEILGKELGKRNNSSLDKLIKELNQLVGLQKVKEEVSKLVIYQKVQSKRKESGLKVPKRTLHICKPKCIDIGKTCDDTCQKVKDLHKDLLEPIAPMFETGMPCDMRELSSKGFSNVFMFVNNFINVLCHTLGLTDILNDRIKANKKNLEELNKANEALCGRINELTRNANKLVTASNSTVSDAIAYNNKLKRDYDSQASFVNE